ncbi:MAG: hypothetical protein J6Y20_07450 [Lachnospiraceae bacterium]|nr:hypothetical protein [Lachnospiraceae bacterium]
MLKNIVRGKEVTDVEYRIDFDRDDGSGFTFPCTPTGELLNPESENYKWCLAHPEEFISFNTLKTIKHTYKEPDTGICSCGATVELVNQYYGACQCPECGRWYNLFGQALKAPEYWNWEGDEE